jgi:hypothetical protein
MLNDEEKLSFLSQICNKLSEEHGITSYEYALLNKIKIDQSNNIEDADYSKNNSLKMGGENNSNDKIIEDRLIHEKIKTNIEKILAYINDKKEYEFIKDYFINEYDNTISTNFIQKDSSNEIMNKQDSENNINNFNFNDSDNINDEFLTLLSKEDLKDINSISKLSQKLNKNNKSKSIELPNLSFTSKKSSSFKEDDIFLPAIKKGKNKNKNNDKDFGLESKEEMDREMEIEINRQIFGFTKQMKESAKHFGAQLRKDNQTLNKIENLQDKVDMKTKKQVKRLEDFNFSKSIGFCKLIFMFLTVFGSFFGTMFIIKILPKLA